MAELGIPFAERMVKFDSDDWERNLGRLSPTRLVPVLWEGEPGTGFATFDTIAILERLHELFPAAGIWPKDTRRPLPRSLAGGGVPLWLRGLAQRHAHEHSQFPAR